MKKDGVESVV